VSDDQDHPPKEKFGCLIAVVILILLIALGYWKVSQH
jgi:hypothetical protein